MLFIYICHIICAFTKAAISGSISRQPCPGKFLKKHRQRTEKKCRQHTKKKRRQRTEKRPESTWLSGPFEDLYSMSSLAVACRGHAASLLSRSGQLTTVSP